MPDYEVVGRRVTALSEWTSLVAKQVRTPYVPDPECFHSFQQADYVSVLGLTEDDCVPLVRQFRPALEATTLELPGGLLEDGDIPAERAAAELWEETGFRIDGDLVHLGTLDPDSGRLENRLWCFFSPRVLPAQEGDWTPECGVEPVLINREDLLRAVCEGQFRHALHVAILGLAVLRGVLTPLSQCPTRWSPGGAP